MSKTAHMLIIKDNHSSVAINYVNDYVEKKIIRIVNQINADIRHENLNNQNGAGITDTLTYTIIKNNNGTIEKKFLNSIIFKKTLAVGNTKRNFEYLRFFPYPEYGWINSPWELFVDDYDSGITILDGLIRLFMLIGLVCLDIEDIRDIFKNNVVIAKCFNDHDLDATEGIITKSEYLLGNNDLKHFIFMPVPKKDPLEKIQEIIQKTKKSLNLDGNIEIRFAAFYPSGTQHKNILFFS